MKNSHETSETNGLTRRAFIESGVVAGTFLASSGTVDAGEKETHIETTKSISDRYQVIVVGLGAMGSACVYHLAKRGIRVLGIEQFDIAHGLGSSGGQTRQTKLAAYVGTPDEPFIRRSLELWRQLETETGQSVCEKTGWLWLKANGEWDYLAGKCEYEILGPQQLQQRYPHIVVPTNFNGLFDPSGGVIRSERAIACHSRIALEHGAELHGREKLLGWEENDKHVQVNTDRGIYQADQLVFCSGAWTGKLLEDLDRKLSVTRLALGWVWPTDRDRFAIGNMPIWKIDNYYGFPMLPDYPGFKLAMHWKGKPTDPDQIDRDPNQGDEELIRECLAQHFPSANNPFLAMKVCMYTHGGPIVSRHPSFQRVSLAAAFGGGGFKFSNVYGELLADLSTGSDTTLPTKHLAL
jgi:sarcosine oxidase